MKKSRLHARRAPIKKKKSYIRYLLLLIVVIIIVLIVSFLTMRHWDGKGRLGIVKEEVNGNVTIELLDPGASGIVKISIPKDTEVTASHELGTWKLGSIWKLGFDQKFGGEFLKSTVIKSFKFPVDEWDGPGNSSLTLWDKFQVWLFSLGVKENQKINIDLADSDYLVRSKLTDGSIGYKISEKMPIFISTLFADPALFNKNINLVINNATGTNREGEMVADVIEVLGIKVTSINKLDENKDDCKITGTNAIAVKKLSKIFGCTVGSGEHGNFDVEVNLGSSFKSRF